MQQLLGNSASSLPPDKLHYVTGRQFFPQLISGPFHHGLNIVFVMAICLLVIASGVSLLRGGRYVHEEQEVAGKPESTGKAALERTGRA